MADKDNESRTKIMKDFNCCEALQKHKKMKESWINRICLLTGQTIKNSQLTQIKQGILLKTP